MAQELGLILFDEEAPREVRRALLTAISQSWNPPPRLFRPLVRLTDTPTSAPTDLLLSAIAAYRTPDAAHALIALMSAKQNEAVRSAASKALISMTGRYDLGTDRVAWQRWLSEHRSLDSGQWRDLLARGVWQRQQLLAAEREDLHARVSDGYRRLYLAMPNEGGERPRLLAQMLSDSTATLRELGLELLWREVSAGKAVDPTVVEAAVQLLKAPDAHVRARAAVLVTQLAPINAAVLVSSALETETSPEAAASLLIAAARWPTKEALEPALYWLEQSPTEFSAAIDALHGMYARGVLSKPEHEQRVVTALRQIDTSALTPAACRLLAQIGGPEDRQRVAQLLSGPSSASRSAAAESLAAYPEFLERILAAAMNDPALFGTAVRAIRKSRPTAAGFAALQSLPARSMQEYREGLARAGDAMPLKELVEVARTLGTDPELSDSILTRLAEPDVPRIGGEAIVDAVLLCEALFALAEARLNLERPDRALAALSTLPDPLPEEADAARARRLRVIAMVWTNQLDLAIAENAPCDDWLAALDRAFAEAHAPAVVEIIRRQFETAMTEAEVDRLEALAARVRSAAIGQAPDLVEDFEVRLR